jgi:hypothetical protein
LRDVETGRRPGEAAFLRNRQCVADLTELQAERSPWDVSMSAVFYRVFLIDANGPIKRPRHEMRAHVFSRAVNRGSLTSRALVFLVADPHQPVDLRLSEFRHPLQGLPSSPPP